MRQTKYVQQVIADGFEKQEIRNELTKRRILAVKQIKANYQKINK